MTFPRTHSQNSLVATLALCALLFSGCAKKNSEAIIGKWRADKSPSVTEFHQDGTMTLNDGAQVTPGRYKFTDNSHMLANLTVNMAAGTKGKLPAGAPAFVAMNLDCTVKISGDDLDMDVISSLATLFDPKKQAEHVHMKRVR